MLVKNGRVIKFTKKTINNAEIIDLNNQIVLPGFINAHIHLGEAFFNLPTKMTLLEYLNYSENFNKKLGENKQAHWDESAHKTLQDCLTFGTCAINLIRGHYIAKDYNIKALCGYPIMKSEKLKCFFEQGVAGYKQYVKECKQNKIIPGVFFHSFYSNDKESFNFALKCNKITKTFFALHLFEDLETEEKVINTWGKDSIMLLSDNKLLNKKTILVHGNYLNDNHLKLIKQKHVSIVTCPISANKLKTKHIDIKKLISKNINWCIATDGLATGETADLLKDAQILYKENIESTEILKALTINPAKALKIKNEVFGIGAFANFNVFEMVDSDNINEIVNKILENNINPKRVYNHGSEVTIDN